MLGSLLYKYLQWKEERKVAIEKKNRTMPKKHFNRYRNW